MIYELIFSRQAKEDLSKLKKSEPQAFKKASKLLSELVEHPTTGSGKPKMLKGNHSGQWSRRISQKHRLIYEIYEEKIDVFILSSYGHYNDI